MRHDCATLVCKSLQSGVPRDAAKEVLSTVQEMELTKEQPEIQHKPGSTGVSTKAEPKKTREPFETEVWSRRMDRKKQQIFKDAEAIAERRMH